MYIYIHTYKHIYIHACMYMYICSRKSLQSCRAVPCRAGPHETKTPRTTTHLDAHLACVCARDR